MQAGDVIRAVNGQQATDLDEFIKLYKQSVKDKDGSVLLDVVRGRGERSVVLKVSYANATTSATTLPSKDEVK